MYTNSLKQPQEAGEGDLLYLINALGNTRGLESVSDRLTRLLGALRGAQPSPCFADPDTPTSVIDAVRRANARKDDLLCDIDIQLSELEGLLTPLAPSEDLVEAAI